LNVLKALSFKIDGNDNKLINTTSASIISFIDNLTIFLQGYLIFKFY
jgi:hypothetical protein